MLAWAPGTGAVGTGAHPFNLEINGVDLIARVDARSIDVEMPGPGNNGSMSFTVWDPTSSIPIIEWDHVRFIEHAASRPVTFGGFVQAVTTTVWAAGGRTHVVQCVGYGVLLDKRFIVAHPAITFIGSDDPVGINPGIGDLLQALISTYGGPITAVGYTTTATVSATVLVHSDWRPNVGLTALSRLSLRSAIEAWASLSFDHRGSRSRPTSMIYWVDASARFHATWLPSDQPTSAFEGAATATTDSSNSPQYSVTFEGDGSDYLNAIYVNDTGADPPQWVREAPHPVAGYIEDTISLESGATGEAAQLGNYELDLRAGSTVVASFSRESSTPVDYRPGMSLTWTNAQLGLAAQKMRITGVRIRFIGGSHRVYTLDLGGRLKASFSRESGKYAIRPR